MMSHTFKISFIGGAAIKYNTIRSQFHSIIEAKNEFYTNTKYQKVCLEYSLD